ncbi:hypothetical protein O181_016839 [Austropuccinia psidii MF-1]|uniref:Integrase catalytic domain-containing protein n=1 Tax=Austropuccinia psidii MF-1 TaxID=1389203 RepID=A0A9Q3C4P4_9BASI|nr:hypothetical protein [Austropuccinia psidii MF-1]
MTALFTSKTLNSDTSNTLVIDCGATHHMFNSKELFSNFVKTEKLLISTSDPKSNLFATGRGTVVIEIENKTVSLPNYLYVPHLPRNLIILLEMFSKYLNIVKQNKDFSILDKNRLILHGHIINNLMISNFTKPTILLTTSSAKIPCWHSRPGHPSNHTLKLMGLPTFEKDHCDICARGKMTIKPFKSHFKAVKQPLDCLHLDLVGPISPPSILGHLFFLTIVDQFTSFKVVRFLKNKSHAIKEFTIVKNLIETAQNQKIKKIVSDRGGEFLNVFSERTNRAILEKAHCLLLGANLPNQYWAEAVKHATFLINLIPTPSRDNQLPLYLWTGNAPRIKHIRTFGCKVIFAIPREKQPWKLAPTGEVGILLGFNYESPAYKILKLKDNKVFSTRHVIFFENDFPCPNSMPKTKENELFFSDLERFQSDDDTFFDCQEHLAT